MEVPEIHNIEFDLYKIKGVDVFDMFKKKVEAKLRELNIKYDIKLVDEHEDEHLMKGGSKSTYPYNVFEDTLDSIVGKKQENQKERKSLFDMLFSSPKDKPTASKSSGLFDIFQSSKKEPDEKKVAEPHPIESKEKESKPIIDEKTMKSITDSEAFSIKKAEVKEAYNTEVPTPSPEATIEEPTVFSEEKGEPSVVKEEEPTVFSEEKEEEEESSIFDEEEEEEVKETMPEVKEEKELVEDFLKTQSVFIKVIVSIYHDKKNEKSLPAKIGIKKWVFN